jgi:hypothetical protein
MRKQLPGASCLTRAKVTSSEDGMNPHAQEMRRTAFQKSAVLKIPPGDALRYATTFLKERGYRAGPAGRPNQLFILGGSEGSLPRVTGEIGARADVGKPGTTLLTVDGCGEQLGPTLRELVLAIRAESKARANRSQTS